MRRFPYKARKCSSICSTKLSWYVFQNVGNYITYEVLSVSFSSGIMVVIAAFLVCVVEEGSSWDMVNENDLWEGGDPELDGEDYVLVRQEDIVDGIACFMAAYLLSLKQTKVCMIP